MMLAAWLASSLRWAEMTEDASTSLSSGRRPMRSANLTSPKLPEEIFFTLVYAVTKTVCEKRVASKTSSFVDQ